MTPKKIAKELVGSYTLSFGNQKLEAKIHAYKLLHIAAIKTNISYKTFYEISKEIEKL
jgi:hypothetical protein